MPAPVDFRKLLMSFAETDILFSYSIKNVTVGSYNSKTWRIRIGDTAYLAEDHPFLNVSCEDSI